MPIQILMPALSPTMEEGTIAKWMVKEGDTVASGDILAEIETDKATMEFEAVDDGAVGKILIPEGSQGVKVNTPIAVLLEDGEDATNIVPPTEELPTKTENPKPAQTDEDRSISTAPTARLGDRVFASPLARRIAAEKGLDISQVSGSGPRGRIVKADVEAATAQPKVAAVPSPTPTVAPTPVDGSMIEKLYQDRDFTVRPLDGMRKTIAARLTEAKQTIPHFYLRRDINLDPLLEFRTQLNRHLAPRDIKLSVNDFIIKACAMALQKVPAANAVWAGDRVLELAASDVAVAVAIEGGLFTPVLKDADQKSLSSLSAEMKDLASRARDRKLAPHEYQGGSFAISNLGMFGIDNFDAVINPPHGAILAVGAGKKKAVVGKDGTIGVGTIMSCTLSVDHRVIDGALGANLLNAIVENLENPMAMLA